MTSNGSAKRPPEVELAALVHGLRHRGLAVGVDDAARIRRLFRHAGDWSHQRRVRALKMLLGRNDEERLVLDQLAPFLFLDAEKRVDRAVKAPDVPFSPSTDAQQHLDSRQRPSGKEVKASGEAEGDSGRGRRWAWWGASAGLLVVVGVLGARWFRPPPEPPPVVPPPMSQQVPPPPAPRVTEEIEVGIPPPPPRWPFALALAVAAVPVWRVASQSRRAKLQKRNMLDVAASEGRRSYRLELPAARRGNHQDAKPIREAAFHLSAPTAEAPAAWLDVDRTVHATVRNAGWLSLRWATWREHRQLLFIEDVSPSMAHWPGFGWQLATSMSRQGGSIERYFMNGNPGVLSLEPDLRRRIPLEQVLAGLTEPAVVVVSDAAVLDRRGARSKAKWLGLLARATWMHPGSVETWGPGARWLVERLRVIPMTDEGLLRLGSPRRGVGALVLPRWRPSQLLARDAEARASGRRATLGEEVFWWLAAGAVIDRVGALSAELWWALHSEGIAPAPRERIDRVWALDEVRVGAAGTVRLDAELRENLISALHRERPDLLSEVVSWAEAIVLADLEDLERGSLARIEARALLARLLLVDPRRRREARRHLRRLGDDGFGDWGKVGRSDEEIASRGRVRLVRTRRPDRGALAGAAAGLLAMGLATTCLLTPKWQRLLFPTRPDFRVLGSTAITPENPLRFYDFYQLQAEVWLQLGQQPKRAQRDSGVPIVWSLDWNEAALADVARPGRVELHLGYDLPLTGEPWIIDLYDVGPVTLTASEQTDPSGRVSLSWSVKALAEAISPAVWSVIRDGSSIDRVSGFEYKDRPEDGVAWEYHVEAVTSDGRPYRSNVVKVRLPPVPLTLNATGLGSQGEVDLGWALVVSEGTAGRPSEWQLIRDGKEIQETTERRWQDRPPGLGPWAYHVKAFDAEGRTYLSNAVKVVLPPGQIALKGPPEVDAEGRVVLRWELTGQAGRVPAKWRVLRNDEQVAQVSETRWSERPTGLGPWRYQVLGQGSQGRRPRSNTLTVQLPEGKIVLDAPSQVDDSGRVTLTWRVANTVGRDAPRQWQVSQNEKPFHTDETSWSGRPRGPGPWEYQISALGPEGRRYASEVALVELPVGEVLLRINTDGSGEVDLHWNVAENHGRQVPVAWQIARDGEEIATVEERRFEDRPPRQAPWEYQIRATGPEGRPYQSAIVLAEKPNDRKDKISGLQIRGQKFRICAGRNSGRKTLERARKLAGNIEKLGGIITSEPTEWHHPAPNTVLIFVESGASRAALAQFFKMLPAEYKIIERGHLAGDRIVVSLGALSAEQ